jgi:group I intron endonuclease
MRGIIYKYTSPSGKNYIGQTTNEKNRKCCFLTKTLYGGGKINNARNKYGACNFTYEVLKEIEENDIDKLHDLLDKYEVEYIKFYNSFKNGYNSTEGGKDNSYVRSKEIKTKISKSRIGDKNPMYGKTHTKETKIKMSENNGAKWACIKPVLQYSESGELINEFNSLEEAANHVSRVPSAIGNCLKGRSKTCAGYIWKYK